jgi:hypothetical protein
LAVLKALDGSDRDALFQQLLNVFEQLMLFGRYQGQRRAVRTGPSGASDTVYIIFRNLR